MRVHVTNVNIPAYSTVGFGTGIDEDGEDVKFVGDHREMRHLGEAIMFNKSDEPVMVDLESWQVVTGWKP